MEVKSASPTQEIILEVENVSKSFPGVKALDNVSFNLRRGEVHALVGENGAGKSTLMKILSGVYQPDEGVIRYKGKPVTFSNVTQAREAGIAIIYQELNLIPHLSVAANIFIGREPLTRFGTLDEKKMNADAVAMLARLNVSLDPTIKLNQLPVSKQQMVEIAKAISFDSEVLIMDEPTSALTESEINELFRIIHTLRDHGVAIIYISHRLDELKHIVDRISILRDGRSISTDDYAAISMGEIVNRMVGRKLENKFPPKQNVPTTEKILEVRHITRAGILHDISFDLYRGEILGIAGLMGAGRSELGRAIFGADPIDGGEVIMNGHKFTLRSPADAIKAGIAYLSENRKEEGLAVKMTLAENVTMANVLEICRRFGVLSRSQEIEVTQRYVKSLNIRTPSLTQIVNNLSGGNQQKVVVAKWLFCDSKILIFDEPTRGIDVGTKYAIYELIGVLAREGRGVIMISSDLPEILGLTDRVLVLHEGRLAATLTTAQTTQEEILNYAAGVA
ncbi:MAG TPA: sugar ABC transporter ATP-binding protein [Anaerolineae bacterium]|nr:sugar ABC transporter ATP-binding protein [Anaerolineae bacterium]HQK15507.1 sugar ABC transporter ATP-binding protein [Anaerolineae bacterium]